MNQESKEGKEWWVCCPNGIFHDDRCLNCGTEIDTHVQNIISLAIQKRDEELRGEIEKIQRNDDRWSESFQTGYSFCKADILSLLTPPKK